MRSRRLTKRIEFYQVTETADGYGGYTVSDELIARSWAKIKTPTNAYTSQRMTDIGITDIQNTIIIHLRHRNDINYNGVNQFIKYNNKKYIIKGVSNIDLNGFQIEIIATREQTDSVEVIGPINV